MKKIIVTIFISCITSICVFAEKTVVLSKKAVTQHKTPIMCFGGWKYTYYTDGQLAGKTSNKCWNSELGWHTVTVTYPRHA